MILPSYTCTTVVSIPFNVVTKPPNIVCSLYIYIICYVKFSRTNMNNFISLKITLDTIKINKIPIFISFEN